MAEDFNWNDQPKADEFDWNSAEKVKEAEPKQRFDLGSVGGVLGAASSVPQLAQILADKIVAGKPLRQGLEQFYSGDKAYVPGDLTAEKVATTPTGQAIVKTAMDVGFDPNTFMAPFAEKAIPQAAEMVARKEPGAGLKALNAVGSFFTGGRMSPKWAKSVAQFEPLERLQPGKTLDEAGQVYGPMKEAADEFMSGNLTDKAKELFDPVRRFTLQREGSSSAPGVIKAIDSAVATESPGFGKLDEAIDAYDKMLQKLGRSKGAAWPPGPGDDLYQGVPSNAMTILNRMKDIQRRGITSAPEAAEIEDFLNMMQWTDFGNPRTVNRLIQKPLGSVRGAMDTLEQESSPAFSTARQRYADAKQMLSPPVGGLMRQHVISNLPAIAGITGGTYKALHGDVRGGAEMALAGALLRSPYAYNAAAAAGGGIAKGLGGIASLASNPAATAALTKLPETDFKKTGNYLGDLFRNNLPALGKYAPEFEAAKQKSGEIGSAIMNNVKQQTDPQYRELINHLTETGEP